MSVPYNARYIMIITDEATVPYEYEYQRRDKLPYCTCRTSLGVDVVSVLRVMRAWWVRVGQGGWGRVGQGRVVQGKLPYITG